MRYYTLAVAMVATTLASPLLVGAASAQNHPPETMSRCNQAVGEMKYEGWPADRMREMMMNSCLNNHGAIPGAQTRNEQKPASLKHQKNASPKQRKLERQRTAPGG